jgi:hypothetical protein
MFIRIDSGYVNIDEVTEIRFRQHAPNETNATLIMKDGRERDTFLSESRIEALCSSVVSAPDGYDVYRPYDLDFDDDGPDPIVWTPVIAFALNDGEFQLTPITAEDGRLGKYAVRAPNGRIYTSNEEFFQNTSEYEESLRKEYAKRKNKVA